MIITTWNRPSILIFRIPIPLSYKNIYLFPVQLCPSPQTWPHLVCETVCSKLLRDTAHRIAGLCSPAAGEISTPQTDPMAVEDRASGLGMGGEACPAQEAATSVPADDYWSERVGLGGCHQSDVGSDARSSLTEGRGARSSPGAVPELPGEIVQLKKVLPWFVLPHSYYSGSRCEAYSLRWARERKQPERRSDWRNWPCRRVAPTSTRAMTRTGCPKERCAAWCPSGWRSWRLRWRGSSVRRRERLRKFFFFFSLHFLTEKLSVICRCCVRDSLNKIVRQKHCCLYLQKCRELKREKRL